MTRNDHRSTHLITQLTAIFSIIVLLAAPAAAQPLAPESPQAAASIAPGFTFEPVVGGLSLPTAIAWAADGRMFIAEKFGRVRVFQNNVLLTENFIDIGPQVNSYADRGLLGIALHPNFPAQPYVYVLFTYDPPGAPADGNGARVNRLLRITASSANTNVAQAGSELVLLGSNSTLGNIGDLYGGRGPASCEANGVPVRDCLPSDSSTHSIGTVMFGKDGMLYVGMGDGAEYQYTDPRALRSQYLNSLSGKVLRIDPATGNGLADNPFYDGDPTSNQSKVFNFGLRNPFRFTINQNTGAVFMGDVGWNTWEEINTGRAKNFGWPCYEGTNPQPGYATVDSTQPTCSMLFAQSSSAVQAPLYQYVHPPSGGGGAALAGAFYTGTVYPPQYKDALFVADYALNRIEYLTFDANGNATPNAFATNVVPNGPLPNGTVPPAGPAHLSVGPDGNVYVVFLNSRSFTASEVRRLRYAGGNTPPLAIAATSPAYPSGPLPLSLSFSSIGSLDPDGQALSYLWNFGDGTTSNQANPTKIYTRTGVFSAVLTVTDGVDNSVSNPIAINAGAPDITITTPISGARYSVSDTLSFAATANDAEDGAIPASQLRWEVKLHHYGHVHFNFASFSGASGNFVVPDHGQGTWIELCAIATDSNNLAGTRCVNLQPNTVSYAFNSIPTAQRIAFDGSSNQTPFTKTVIVNSALDVAAPSSQNGLVFGAWSDGGARSRSQVFGVMSQTLTVTYSTPAPASCTGTGSIVREYWNDIAGYSVSDLTNNPNFPNTSSGSQSLASFEAPTNFGESYGARIRGFVCPPTSGAYTFWLASDDSSQLFLSSNEDPANKQRLINFAGWVPQRNWTRYPQQASRPITLTAGTRYYIEVLHKEKTGNDHLSVAWHGPGLDAQIISGQYLAPFITNTVPNTPTSFVIYDDALASGWANWSSGASLDFNATSPVQTGTKSVQATMTAAYGTLALRAPAALTLTNYVSLDFWVYGGPSGNTLAAFIQEGDATPTSDFVFFTAPANTWKNMSIPLAAFGSFAQLKRVNIQDVSGQSGGQYFLDDVKLVGSGTPPTTNDAVLYDDAVAAGWLDWSFNATANFNNTSVVTVGAKSALVNVAAPYGTFTLRGSTALSASLYQALSFWVYGGPSGNRLAAFVQGADSGATSTFVFFSTQANTWQKITLPLSAFGAVSQIKRVNLQDTSGQSGGQYVLDDVRLVGNFVGMNASNAATENRDRIAAMITSQSDPIPERAEPASAVLMVRPDNAGTVLSWQLRGMTDAQAVQVFAGPTNQWRDAKLLTRSAATPEPQAFVDETSGSRFYWLVIEREDGGSVGVGPVQAEATTNRLFFPLVQ